MLLLYMPSSGRGRPGRSGADASTCKYFVWYSTMRKTVSVRRFRPLCCPLSCSRVGSRCSMACSIARSGWGKNAHIWPFSGFMVYANVSIIIASRADLGPFRGCLAAGDLPGGGIFFTAARRMYHPILQFLVKISLTGVCSTPTIVIQATKTALFSVFT